MFDWKKEFETGVQDIDLQHQNLFKIGNRIQGLLDDMFKEDHYDSLVHVIDELRDYTIFHFDFEEKYMLEVGYKKFFSHKVKHQEFIHKFSEVDYKKLDENQKEAIHELLIYLKNWIVDHILLEDFQYTDSKNLREPVKN